MSTSRADEALQQADVEVGELLAGKYRIERLLGVGGMGVVVEATHVDLEEKVALKFLANKALRKNKKAVARFIREAKAAVKIKSEHVTRVSDVGTLASGAPYIVMEFLEGDDLARVVRDQGALKVRDAVDYVLQAGEAVAQAHALGIVHRDLKPANLFLTRRPDGSPRVKVLDFGISKLRSEGFGADQSITGTHAVMGSPAYMAPEQWVSAKDADMRSDVWSLGAILYELLAGRPPFRGGGMAQICNQVMNSMPPDLRVLRPGLPDQLARAVETCLEKEAIDRFQNLGELAAELNTFATQQGRLSAGRIIAVMRNAGLLEHAVQLDDQRTDTEEADQSAGTVAGGTPDSMVRSQDGYELAGESFISASEEGSVPDSAPEPTGIGEDSSRMLRGKDPMGATADGDDENWGDDPSFKTGAAQSVLLRDALRSATRASTSDDTGSTLLTTAHAIPKSPRRATAIGLGALGLSVVALAFFFTRGSAPDTTPSSAASVASVVTPAKSSMPTSTPTAASAETTRSKPKPTASSMAAASVHPDTTAEPLAPTAPKPTSKPQTKPVSKPVALTPKPSPVPKPVPPKPVPTPGDVFEEFN